MDKFLVGARPPPAPLTRAPKRVSAEEQPRTPPLRREKYSVRSLAAELAAGEFDPFRPPSSPGQSLPFFLVAETLAAVAEQRGKSSAEAKRQLLKNMFLAFLHNEPSELGPLFLFLTGRLAEDWAKTVSGVGTECLKRAIQTATGAPLKSINESVRTLGDLGAAFEHAREGQNTLSGIFGAATAERGQISFAALFAALRSLADINGENSQSERETILVELLRAVGPIEGRFVCRFVLGGMGIGAAEKMQISALARAFCDFFATKGWESGEAASAELEAPPPLDLPAELDFVKALLAGRAPPLPPTAELIASPKADPILWETLLTRILIECPDHCLVIEKLIATRSLSRVRFECRLRPLLPCKPMLAKPLKDLSAILTRLENRAFTCEFKYDGLRGQAHVADGKLRVFSRNLDDLSATYPELAPPLLAIADGRSVILDGEVVAWDKAAERVLPFQLLTCRAKKAVEGTRAADICFFIFDVLLLDGRSLLKLSLAARRAVLRALLPTPQPTLRLAAYRDCQAETDVQAFLEEAVAAGCEGLMVKLLEDGSSYEPAKRSFKWLKVKKDYLELGGLGDSLDLVVIGANHGEGRRRGRYGAFLMAVFNSDLGVFEACCLVGTGVSDAQLADFKERFDALQLPTKPTEYVVERGGEAQVWFRAAAVWEVRAADIQQSPVYLAGRGAPGGRGLGLRFPRLVRERPDKRPEQCSTSRFLLELYRAQTAVPLEDEDDDYY